MHDILDGLIVIGYLFIGMGVLCWIGSGLEKDAKDSKEYWRLKNIERRRKLSKIP